LETIGYRETSSGSRESLRDKTGEILGRFETDTKVTRDVHGTITGRGSNPIFATGGCMVAQVPENQGWLGKGL
jgi:hypothetical protein